MKKTIIEAQHFLIDYLKIHRSISIIVLSVVVGITGGYCAIGFRFLIRYIQNLAINWADTEKLLTYLMDYPWQYRLLVPMSGGLLLGLVIRYISREAREQGVPEVMKAIAFSGGRMQTRFLLIKTLASALTIGSGGSVGREGPIVHIGCSIGSQVGHWLNLSGERRKILVACGAAAGIAATFNAPITGVLFAIEVILGAFAIQTFSPLVVSSVLATMISRRHLGNATTFLVPHFEFRSPWELVLYLGLGMAIGMVGLFFIKLMAWTETRFLNLPMPVVMKSVFGMGLLGLLIVRYPHLYGNGYETITLALSNNLDLWTMATLTLLKIVAVCVTFASGGSGGFYSPALFIGAVSGGAFGSIVHRFLPDITATSNAYAMVGMGALVSSIMHAPFTAIITMFELTGDYTIILPVMSACIVSSLVTTHFKKESIYTDQLKREGLDIDTRLETTVMKRHIIRDIMHTNISTIDPDMPFDKLFNLVMNSDEDHFYVVGRGGLYLGHLSLQSVAKTMKFEGMQTRRRAIDLMDKSYPRINPDETLIECVRAFGVHGFQEFPVVGNNGVFLGVINHQDIFILYNREILQNSAMSLKFISKAEDRIRSDFVNIPDDYMIEVLPVMGKLAGRTIKDLELRKKYSITVVAIRPVHNPSAPAELPRPNRNLTRQDALIVVGMVEDLERLRREMRIA